MGSGWGEWEAGTQLETILWPMRGMICSRVWGEIFFF